MSKISYLEENRKPLQSLRKQCLWCLIHDKSYIETSWDLNELNYLEGALSNIKTSTKMRRFMERKEAVIHYLMPARNIKQHDLLHELARS